MKMNIDGPSPRDLSTDSGSHSHSQSTYTVSQQSLDAGTKSKEGRSIAYASYGDLYGRSTSPTSVHENLEQDYTACSAQSLPFSFRQIPGHGPAWDLLYAGMSVMRVLYSGIESRTFATGQLKAASPNFLPNPVG